MSFEVFKLTCNFHSSSSISGTC